MDSLTRRSFQGNRQWKWDSLFIVFFIFLAAASCTSTTVGASIVHSCRLETSSLSLSVISSCVGLTVPVCFAAAAVSALHLFLSHQSGTDGLQTLHGPTLTLAVWPSLPFNTHTHRHTCLHIHYTCVYINIYSSSCYRLLLFMSLHSTATTLSAIWTTQNNFNHICEHHFFLHPVTVEHFVFIFPPCSW